MKNKTYPCWSWLPIPLVPTIKTFTALLKPSMTQSVHPSIHPSIISHFLDKEDVSHNNIYIYRYTSIQLLGAFGVKRPKEMVENKVVIHVAAVIFKINFACSMI